MSILLQVFSFFLFSAFAHSYDLEDVGSLGEKLNQIVQSPYLICIECEHDVFEDSSNFLKLAKEEYEIDTNYRGGESEAIIFMRDENTPRNVKLRLNYLQRVCLRTVAYQNPLSGDLGIGCLMYGTEKRSTNIRLRFRGSLDGGEKQIFSLNINKHIDSRRLHHEIVQLKGPKAKIDDQKRILGLFGHRYEIRAQ